MTRYINILTTHDRSRIAEENDILLIIGYWIIQSTGKYGGPFRRRANANLAFFSVSFSGSTH
jgi:hypothetical protein